MKKENALIRIVDDDASVRDALVYMLEQEGFDTVAYASAEEFLVNDMPSRPGVVVLDVRMPGMSGTRLQDEMIARRIDTPIIFLTGHGDVDMSRTPSRLCARGPTTFCKSPSTRTNSSGPCASVSRRRGVVSRPKRPGRRSVS